MGQANPAQVNALMNLMGRAPPGGGFNPVQNSMGPYPTRTGGAPMPNFTATGGLPLEQYPPGANLGALR